MAQNDGNYDVPGGDAAPIIPAPTRSRRNLANRARAAERSVLGVPRSPVPPRAAKPPLTTIPANYPRRRRGDTLPAVRNTVVRVPEGPPPRPPAEVPAAETSSSHLPVVRTFAAGCFLMLICLLQGVPTRTGPDGPPTVAPERSAALPPAPHEIPKHEMSEADTLAARQQIAGAALTSALDDLDDAVESFPQQSPEQLLRRVSQPGQDCMLLWNKNYPSILFGRMPISENSLATSLEGCARAIRQLPH